MREIKFRGYVIEELIGTQWVTDGFGVEKVEYTDGTNSVHLITPYGEYEVYEKSVGQYTGLKDKNGKEIYEGDIIEFLPTLHGIVKYNNDNCYFGIEYIETTYPNDIKQFGSWVSCYEIVGNMYDNSKLLNEIEE